MRPGGPVSSGSAGSRPGRSHRDRGGGPPGGDRPGLPATAEELDTLPGIGESLARRIIAYREANGPFGSIEEIMEVSGIGEAKFAELEDRVTVDNGKGEVTNEDSGG